MGAVLSSILEVHHSITNMTLCIPITAESPPRFAPQRFFALYPHEESLFTGQNNNSVRCYQIVSLNLTRRFLLFSTLQLNLLSFYKILSSLPFFVKKCYTVSRQLDIRAEDPQSGLKITADQRTMSDLIGALTGQTFVLPVMLTGHICWSHS